MAYVTGNRLVFTNKYLEEFSVCIDSIGKLKGSSVLHEHGISNCADYWELHQEDITSVDDILF